jgi:EmrB/QacA subfamily drug resistance transporter
MTSSLTAPAAARTAHSRRWWILAIVAIAQLMVVLDATIVNIALPSAQRDLHFSDSARQWVITAYTLGFGSLLLLGGRIGDLFGRKRVFVAGLAGFAVASAVGGAAPGFGVLIGARALQGIFGALLAPAALSVLTTTFTDARERGQAFGIYGAVAGGGGAVGLLLGGVLTEYLSWRWCLFVNLAFAVPAALGVLAFLHDGARAARPSLDLPGTLTASSGLLALVYGFTEAARRGWADGVTLGFLAAGVVLLGLFVWLQARAAHPLVPPRVVLDRDRGGSYLSVGIVGVGMFGAFLFLTYYLQQTLSFSPIQTGLAFLPLLGVLIVTSTVANTLLLARIGPRPLVSGGLALSAVAMVMLTRVGVHSAYATHVLPSLLVLGLGLGAGMAAAMNTATLGVDPGDAGVASAMVNTGQQVGGSIGTALLNTLAASAVGSYVAGHAHVPGLLAQAQVHGYVTAFWWSAAIFAIGAVVCGLLIRPGGRQPEQVVEREAAAEPVLVGS